MKLGKAKFIFDRAWSWMSKTITVANFLMLAYLVIQENELILMVFPVLLVGWIVITVYDLKKILPEELEYWRQKDPAWVEFTTVIQTKLSRIEKKLEEKK